MKTSLQVIVTKNRQIKVIQTSSGVSG